MKKNILSLNLLLISLFIITSCNVEDPELPAQTQTINATVENGNNFNTFISKVKAVVSYETIEFDIASTEYKNGGFNLTLPAPLPENMLFAYGEEVEEPEPFIKLFSDKDVKLAPLKIVAYDVNGNEIQYFRCTDADGEEVSVDYLYVDRDCTMKGRVVNNSYSTTSNTIEYDASFKRGWNVVYMSSKLITTQKPENVSFKWHYLGENALKIREYENYKFVYTSDGKTIYLRFVDNKYVISAYELKALDIDQLYQEYVSRDSWSSSDDEIAGTWTTSDSTIVFRGAMSPGSATVMGEGQIIYFNYLYFNGTYYPGMIFTNY